MYPAHQPLPVQQHQQNKMTSATRIRQPKMIPMIAPIDMLSLPALGVTALWSSVDISTNITICNTFYFAINKYSAMEKKKNQCIIV